MWTQNEHQCSSSENGFEDFEIAAILLSPIRMMVDFYEILMNHFYVFSNHFYNLILTTSYKQRLPTNFNALSGWTIDSGHLPDLFWWNERNVVMLGYVRRQTNYIKR